MFAYCDNNPIERSDATGELWNTFFGAVAGAIIGGIGAAVTGADVLAGVASGAISGAITGAAIDITIATCGTGLVAFAAVTAAGGIGGAASSAVNQIMTKKPNEKIKWDEVAIDGVTGAIGAALSFGVGDVGGKTAKTLGQTLAMKGKAVLGQAAFDLGANLVVGFGTWCLGAKMKALLCL